MELIVSPTSPFARKVQILAQEQGLADDITLRKLHPIENADELAAINPLGRVPALRTDNGQLVVDSSVICAWLDNLAVSRGKATLLGEGPPACLAIQQLQALADGIMESAFLMVMERGRPPALQSGFWQERRQAAVTRTLDYLESGDVELMPTDLHLGSIALACALGYLDFRHDDMQWRAGRPLLTAWFSDWEVRESFLATQPPG